jgi:hypothetical protein
MTIVTLILFGSVILMGACLAYWLVSRRGETTALPNSKTLTAEAKNLERYRTLTRLLSDDDIEFVAKNIDILGSKASEQLLRSRRRILRSYLRELRRDFARFWSLCRLLAPYAPDPEFGAMLMGQLFLFHSTLTVVWLRTFSPSVGLNQIQFGALIDGVQQLRDSAQSAVEGAEQFALDMPAA